MGLRFTFFGLDGIPEGVCQGFSLFNDFNRVLPGFFSEFDWILQRLCKSFCKVVVTRVA